MARPPSRESFIGGPASDPNLSARAQNPAYHDYLILYVGFIAAPLIAGADKFFHLLTNWDQLPAPPIARMLPLPAHTFALVVRVIEIVAAGRVPVKPWLRACVLTALL